MYWLWAAVQVVAVSAVFGTFPFILRYVALRVVGAMCCGGLGCSLLRHRRPLPSSPSSSSASSASFPIVVTYMKRHDICRWCLLLQPLIRCGAATADARFPLTRTASDELPNASSEKNDGVSARCPQPPSVHHIILSPPKGGICEGSLTNIFMLGVYGSSPPPPFPTHPHSKTAPTGYRRESHDIRTRTSFVHSIARAQGQ